MIDKNYDWGISLCVKAMSESFSYKSDLRVSRREMSDQSESKVQEKVHYLLLDLSNYCLFLFSVWPFHLEL